MLEIISKDGLGCSQMESSNSLSSSGNLFSLCIILQEACLWYGMPHCQKLIKLFCFIGKIWVSPSERYAIVPGETVNSRFNFLLAIFVIGWCLFDCMTMLRFVFRLQNFQQIQSGVMGAMQTSPRTMSSGCESSSLFTPMF